MTTRDEFEAWRRATCKNDPDKAVARHGLGDEAPYVDRTTRCMWVAWRDLSAITKAPELQEKTDGHR